MLLRSNLVYFFFRSIFCVSWSGHRCYWAGWGDSGRCWAPQQLDSLGDKFRYVSGVHWPWTWRNRQWNLPSLVGMLHASQD
jgi:hypothetical protein